MQIMITLTRAVSTYDLDMAMCRIVERQSETPWHPKNAQSSPDSTGWNEGDRHGFGQRSCQSAGNIRLLRADGGVYFNDDESYRQIIVETSTPISSGYKCSCHRDYELDERQVFDNFVTILKEELDMET